MKLYNKYLGICLLSLGIISCDDKDVYPTIEASPVEKITAKAGTANFSKYVSLGASFTAGFADNALFKSGQKNSFPNILASKFALVGGGEFTQPLMNDDIGGLLFGGQLSPTGGFRPRLYFDGKKPTVLKAMPTTEFSTKVTTTGNFGVPGAKSFHLLASGYGNALGVSKGLANPYFVRFATSPTATIIGDAMAQSPTFFTLSEIGGNDVLGYALSGGSGVNQSPTADSPTGNLDPSTYGRWDITNPLVFQSVYSKIVNLLTANGAKGVVANVPYITSLAHFTTVPYNPVPLDEAKAKLMNQGFSTPYNAGIRKAFAALVQMKLMTQEIANAEIAKRTINFAPGQNAVVIVDEKLTDLAALNPAFAELKQYRQATKNDLLVLPSSSFIGTTVNNNPKLINGLTVPLGDKWVLTPEEQVEIKTATDAYNKIIEQVATSKGLALVDFKAILEKASTTGYTYGDYTMTTNLVTGGLISLDGVHLTARGYAVMAAEILKAIDATYGSNFEKATNGLPNVENYPTNYSPKLQ